MGDFILAGLETQAYRSRPAKSELIKDAGSKAWRAKSRPEDAEQ